AREPIGLVRAASDNRCGGWALLRRRLICIKAGRPHAPMLKSFSSLSRDSGGGIMGDKDDAKAPRDVDLFSPRGDRIGVKPERLNPDQLATFRAIQQTCPACQDPLRCLADLVLAAPKEELEDWDEYCPNAAKLRILAALTMYGPEPT